MIKDELSSPIDEITFWTESMIALGYILNDTKGFHLFVADKVKSVREYTSKKQWCYLDTSSNRTDHASHGIVTNEPEKVSNWLNVADILWQPKETWCVQEVEEIADDDQKVLPGRRTKCNLVRVNIESISILSTLESLYSCWHYIMIVLATMLRSTAKCQGKHCPSILTVRGV